MMDAKTLGQLSTLTGLFGDLTESSGTFLDAASAKSEGEFKSSQYAYSAAISDMLADEAIRLGLKRAAQLKIRARGLIGKQRAGYAGQNVVVSSGSAAEVQEDTVRQSTLDSLELQNNAWKEAWGYRAQAVQQRGAAEMQRIATDSAYKQSLISGGVQMATSLTSAAGGFL